jgi:hypothetical protein
MEDQEITRIFYFSQIIFLLTLLLLKAYAAILICILFAGFYKIVVRNKKYKYMKDYIELFF